MRKIFFVTNEMTGGGAERVMTVLANYFDEKGYKVAFLVLQRSDTTYALSDRIDLYNWKQRKSGDAIGQIKFIRSFMKQNPGAVFISFFTHQNLYSILASAGLNVRIIVSERNDPEYSIHGRTKKLLRSVLYASKMCDKIVFQTKGAGEYFSNKVQKKGVIIANPLKKGLPDRFNGIRSKTIVSIGRFDKQKNYNMLIEAFAEFSKMHNDYKLILYGKGDLENEIKAKVNELGISAKVEFAGFRQNVHELVLDSAMFVLTSNYEGLSNSMLEAMAIGLPVICTDCPPGGAKEYIINKENGILVPVGNVQKACEAMCYLAEHPHEASEMGKRASELRGKLSSDIVCKQWEQIIG